MDDKEIVNEEVSSGDKVTKKSTKKSAKKVTKEESKKDVKYVYTWIAKGTKRVSQQTFNSAEEAINAAVKIGTGNPKAEEV